MRINRTSIAALSLVAALAFAQACAVSASAEDFPEVVEFNDPTTQTLEYGQYWNFGLTTDDWTFATVIYDQGFATATMTGVPSGFTPEFRMYPNYTTGQSNGYVAAPYDAPPLSAGSYTITVQGSITTGGNTYSGTTSPPATLTVEKAKLGIELRAIADQNNPTGIVVTARFTGRFVDEYQSSFFAGAAKSPEGTWHITIKDDAGEVATEQSVERAAGDDVLATSFYWEDAEPGVKYTTTAEFVVSGSSASNFAVANAQQFQFTGGEEQRPVPSSTATGKPDASLPEPAGFGLPLWSLIVAGALILALGALVTVLSVRLRRRPAETTAEVSA